MAKYRIKAPDGNSYEVTAPDDATPDQVLAYAQQNYQPPAQPRQVEHVGAEARDPTEGISGIDRFRAGFGKAFVDTGAGIKQAVTESVGRHAGMASVGLRAAGLDDAADAVVRRAVVPAIQSQQRQQTVIDDRRANDAALMDTGAGFAGNITGQIAQAAAPGGVAVRGARAANLANAAAQGGAFAAAQPVVTGDSRGLQTAIGAGSGAFGQGIARGAARLAKGASDKLSPVVRELAEKATAAGIPLHISQLADSIPLKTAASVAKYLPFSGAGRAASNQQAAFNRAMSRGFGNESDVLTDEVMATARQKIGAGYDDVFSRNNVTVRPDTLRKMAAIEADAAKNLTGDEARIVANQVDRILADAGEGGQMTGRMYQSLRGALAGVKPGTDIGNYVTRLRNALESDAAASLGAQDAKALTALNRQWNNLRTTEDLLRQVAGAGGDVKPSALWAAVNKRGPKATPEMRELARVGQVLLKDPIPDSGTAGRLFTGGLMAGGASPMGIPAALASLPAGAAIGRALNSPALGNYLVRGGGPALGNIARLLSPAGYLLPAAARSEVGKQKPAKKAAGK